MIEIEGFTDVTPIGQGGVGVVYRATRTSTGRVVAIKVLRDVSDESVAWHRTRRELTALVALAGHANVIQLFELFELDQGPALSMEYAPGGSVADLLDRRDEVVTPAETVFVGRQIAAALAAAHAQGIVHRDIKPHNLLIDAFGQVKLCDFGIAALTRTDGFRTRTNAWSMRYASPEDLDGDVEVGPASDVYSLGATLLHLAHGAPPSLKDRLVEWVPPEEDDPHRRALDLVLASCLQPDPDRRPSADELVERLEQLGWSLDERCRMLPVESPTALDEHERRIGRSHAAAGDPVVDVVRSSDPPGFDSDPDETVVRAGRRPQSKPIARPEARRRWPRWSAVAAVLLVFVVAAVVWWPNGSNEANEAASAVTLQQVVAAPSAVTVPPTTESTVVSTSNSTSTIASTSTGVVTDDPVLSFVDRPAGLVPIDDPGVVWPFGGIGECLVQQVDVVELRRVSCDQPHDLQRIAVTELDAAEFPEGSAFDQAAVQATVEMSCASAFDSVVTADSDIVFDVPVTRPSAASWQQGDRRFQCLVGVARKRVIGDASALGGEETAD